MLKIPRLLVAVSIALLAVVSLRAARVGGVGGMVGLGEDFTDGSVLPAGVQATPGLGYDGQFFYRIALNPFTTKQSDFGITLDDPSYRHQRILYPLMAWVMSGGRALFIPYALILLNIIAMLVIAYVGLKLASDAGLTAWAGLMPVLVPGLLLSVARDLGEPVTLAFLIAAVYAAHRQLLISSALLLVCAVLTREGEIVTCAAFGIAAAISCVVALRRRERPVPWLAPVLMLLPLIAYISLQVAMHRLWGTWPFAVGERDHLPFAVGDRTGSPFAGFVEHFVDVQWRAPPATTVVQLAYMVWHVVVFVEVLRAVRRWLAARRAGRSAVTSPAVWWALSGFVVWTAFGSTFAAIIWLDDWGFTRILASWSVLGLTTLLLLRQEPGDVLKVWTVALLALSCVRLALVS